MPSNHLVLCRPLLLPPSIFPSIRVFSNELALCIRWPKYWNFIFSISPSDEYSGLISFRMDWLDLLAVQGTLQSLLQHHSSKASNLQRSTFFTKSYPTYLSHLRETPRFPAALHLSHFSPPDWDQTTKKCVKRRKFRSTNEANLTLCGMIHTTVKKTQRLRIKEEA